MIEKSVEIKGLEEFKAALKRNPELVVTEARKFLQRSMAAYRAGIQNNPWRMGMSGGGVPWKTGNLSQSHAIRFDSAMSASIGPSRAYPVRYATYVHGIEGYPRKRTYQLRPWLDYVKQQKDSEVNELWDYFLQTISVDLAK